MDGRGLSELLSALILLAISVAVAMVLVSYLPIASPPSSKPWLRPVVVDAYKSGSSAYICLYNPHPEPIQVVEAWAGGIRLNATAAIRPYESEWMTVEGVPAGVERIILRLGTGALMGVDLA